MSGCSGAKALSSGQKGHTFNPKYMFIFGIIIQSLMFEILTFDETLFEKNQTSATPSQKMLIIKAIFFH